MSATLDRVIHTWSEVKDVLSIPQNEKQYQRLVKLMDELLDKIGENEKHPLMPLLDTIGSLVESYENEHVKLPEGKPIDVLKHFMHVHELTQKDMKMLGSQGVVSELLSGKRSLNTKQIKALAQKFGVSPAVFI